MAIRSRILSSKSPKHKFHRIILALLLLATIIAIIIAFTLFRFLLKPNVFTGSSEQVSVFIPKGSDYNDVRNILYSKSLIINRHSFEWVAGRKNYPGLVKPGHYVIKNSMSNNELINLLRSGAQTPVRVTFNNIRKKEDLAGKLTGQIEAIRCHLSNAGTTGNF